MQKQMFAQRRHARTQQPETTGYTVDEQRLREAALHVKLDEDVELILDDIDAALAEQPDADG